MLPVHIKEIKKQSIFDTTTTHSLTPVLKSNSTQSEEPRTRFPFGLCNTTSIYQNVIEFDTPSWQEEGSDQLPKVGELGTTSGREDLIFDDYSF